MTYADAAPATAPALPPIALFGADVAAAAERHRRAGTQPDNPCRCGGERVSEGGYTTCPFCAPLRWKPDAEAESQRAKDRERRRRERRQGYRPGPRRDIPCAECGEKPRRLDSLGRVKSSVCHGCQSRRQRARRAG